MNVTDGAYLKTLRSYLGDQPGSTGEVTISDAGSLWDNDAEMNVGCEGPGSVNVANGAQVISQATFIGCSPGADSIGAVTISGAGSTWVNPDHLSVGYYGRGTLDITDGGAIDNRDDGYIGDQPGSIGVATVSGAGSTWNTRHSLHVGDYGHGTLNITDGAEVTSGYGRIGNQPGSIGRVNVSGIGSTWTNSGDLYIGNEGDGELNISDDGLVAVDDNTYIASLPGAAGVLNFDNGTLTTNVLWADPSNMSGTGVINTNGLMMDIDLVFDAAHGAAQTFAIDGPGRNITVNLGVGSSTLLGVGYQSSGSMHISGGLSIASGKGRVGYLSGATGAVTISGAGSSWDLGRLYVGCNGDGRIDVTDGGSLIGDLRDYLGDQVGASGVVRISGAGSSWTGHELDVGNYGHGELEISNGASVTHWDAYVGQQPDSTGTVTVSGEGSTWAASYDLCVGRYGAGTLTVSDRGTVNCNAGIVGSKAGSFGVANVSGVGSSWSTEYGLFVGNFGSGVLNVTGGGAVNSGSPTFIGCDSDAVGAATVSGPGSIWISASGPTVGYKGSGVLNITNGGAVVGEMGASIGAAYHSVGIARVSGVGSTWTNASGLGVGGNGQATLEITDGAIVSNATGKISSPYYSFVSPYTSVVTVSGSGSAWNNSIDFYVGYYGHGVLNISDGGVVSVGGNTYVSDAARSSGTINFDNGVLTTGGFLGAPADLNGSGVINAKGLVSDVDFVFNDASSLSRVITFTGPGKNVTINLDIDGSAPVGVGHGASASMHVSDGFVLQSHGGRLGYQTGSSGVATVSGDGSTWESSHDIHVGVYGYGSLTISDRGTVNGKYGYVGGDGYNGYVSESVGVVSVSGEGSSWNNDYSLYVGRYGRGTLDITDGADVSSRYSHIASEVGSIGVVRVDQVGSTWITSGCIDVGSRGRGEVKVTDGGVITSDTGRMGSSSDAIGSMTVSGSGSTWTNSGYLWIGYSGAGSMDITDGATVSNTDCYMGREYDGSGSATVNGATWTNNGGLYVGYDGDGELVVTGGGVVSSEYGSVGTGNISDSSVTVSGAGSTWANSGGVSLGGRGSGDLNISDGGLISIGGELSIDYSGGADSFINMGSGGMLALYGDADSSLAEFLGLIEGPDAIRFWDDASWSWVSLTSAAPGDGYSLVRGLHGNLSGYTVLTVNTPYPIPGDSNHDYIVDDDDYDNLVAQFGAAPGDESADFNGDGIVDLADFIIMRDNFGSGVVVAAPDAELTAVTPEPATGVLLLLGFGAVMRRRQT